MVTDRRRTRILTARRSSWFPITPGAAPRLGAALVCMETWGPSGAADSDRSQGHEPFPPPFLGTTEVSQGQALTSKPTRAAWSGE